jgi:GGDEF-like domain
MSEDVREGAGRARRFVMNEAEVSDLSNHGSALHHIRRTQEALLEHLTAAIEHDQEREQLACSPEQRLAEIAQSTLSGVTDPNDLAELDYDIHSSWHVALIAAGPGAGEVLNRLKAHFGRRVLVVHVDGVLWAWLGGQERPSEKDIERASIGRLRASLGIGEPGLGLDGWRLTHDQARAALAVALRTAQPLARYADDRLLAAALESDTLARSLKQKYLTPLYSQRDGGTTLRRTLRTYIDLDRNATSASEVLNVGRRAVKSRICTAERLMGSQLHECMAELDVALRLAELDMFIAADGSVSRK